MESFLIRNTFGHKLYELYKLSTNLIERVLLLLVASQFLGISRMDEQDNRVGFRFLPLFRRFADEFVIEPHIGLAFFGIF